MQLPPRLAIAIALVGCGTEDVFEDPPPDPARRCVVTVTGRDPTERLEAELEAPGRPLWMKLTRDGAPRLGFTYAYDAAGQLVAEQHDVTRLVNGGQASGADGIDDFERAFEHGPTTVIERFRQLPDGPFRDEVTSTLDAEQRLTRFEGTDYRVAYQLGAGGRVERIDIATVDADTREPFTTATINTFDDGGRLAVRRVEDSRYGSTSFTYEYTEAPGALTIQRLRDGVAAGARHVYAFDPAGRLTSLGVDDEPDGVIDFVVAFTHADDGAVTAEQSREGGTARRFELSAACGYVPDLTRSLRAAGRPGPAWELARPFIPSPFE